ncbi:hypothetical protein K432DRAFT_399650, partial [Lepidopterella palustris CBS 459.81]
MRLMFRNANGEYEHKNLKDDDPIPSYAILSHTWSEGQEVTFHDLIDGAGKSELQNAINSMFRWYRKATRCYVYLSDVSTTGRKTSDQWAGFTWESARRIGARFTTRKASDRLAECTWESAFQQSRWFTRGWTLQELLAPASVEFFSREGERLGDKDSLQQQIHEITGVPKSALQGVPLTQFSNKERFSWIEYRQTKVEEDKVYSLLGIFGIEMHLRYGEGLGSAFKRLEEEIEKLNKCLRDLRSTDPNDDKKRIESTRGGLLEDSYRWILDNLDFQRWRNEDQSRLLWIKGDPGKGKTMLLCGIINEMEKSIAKTGLLSYFFCQATDSRINNATAVLRGLMYMLVCQQPSLISHIRKKYDHAGKGLFEDTNTWVALVEIFTDILQDPNLNSTYLIIDALDECVTDLPKLLHFIVQKSSTSSRVNWIISGRNWPSIEKYLDTTTQKVRLCLELNEHSVSAAVSTYIQFKVDRLAERNRYDNAMRVAVKRYLEFKANGTFFWVALVCQELADTSGWKVQEKLKLLPPGLNALYQRMIDQIWKLGDAEFCKRILAVISAVYRPVTLDELASFVDMPDGVSGNDEALSEIIGLCGSFLTLQKRTISFVHQSAKEFLLKEASNALFPSGIGDVHYSIFSRSLQVMSRTLRRDIYSLRAPGYPIEKVKQLYPDPLAASRYSCIYWVDHFCKWNSNSRAEQGVDLREGSTIEIFIKKKYLYWLEALSLCRGISGGVASMTKLEVLFQGRPHTSALLKLVHDARRFIMYFKRAIEQSPLQAYTSALVFSPAYSLIRRLFKEEEPKWIKTKPAVEDNWNACLQTLEGHSDGVNSVAFSPDSARLASASGDNTVKIWDASSGACLRTLEGHTGSVSSVAFSPDSARLASASWDGTVKIWDANSGACLQTLEDHTGNVSSVAFSPDSARLASASWDNTVKIWDASSGACLQTLEGHANSVNSVAFSPDSARLASASGNILSRDNT